MLKDNPDVIAVIEAITMFLCFSYIVFILNCGKSWRFRHWRFPLHWVIAASYGFIVIAGTSALVVFGVSELDDVGFGIFIASCIWVILCLADKLVHKISGYRPLVVEFTFNLFSEGERQGVMSEIHQMLELQRWDIQPPGTFGVDLAAISNKQTLGLLKNSSPTLLITQRRNEGAHLKVFIFLDFMDVVIKDTNESQHLRELAAHMQAVIQASRVGASVVSCIATPFPASEVLPRHVAAVRGQGRG